MSVPFYKGTNKNSSMEIWLGQKAYLKEIGRAVFFYTKFLIIIMQGYKI